MPVAVTSNTIINAAIQLIGGNQAAVNGLWPNFDTSAAGRVGNAIYQDTVQACSRKFGYDFSRNVAALALTGNVAPAGWTYEYAYPTNGIQVRQIFPAVIPDKNDPAPENWTVGNMLVLGVPTKVIWADLANAQVSFTNQPTEGLWDALFIEEVIRMLASGLAMGIAGRPDTAQAAMESAGVFGQAAQSRDG